MARAVKRLDPATKKVLRWQAYYLVPDPSNPKRKKERTGRGFPTRRQALDEAKQLEAAALQAAAEAAAGRKAHFPSEPGLTLGVYAARRIAAAVDVSSSTRSSRRTS